MLRRLLAPAALAALAWSGPAAAHADYPVTPDAVWVSWSFDPLVLVPLMLAHWLYGRGWLRLPERLRSRSALASFAAGEGLLFAALVSPIDPLGETLLSMHMVQHMLLVALAPPLLLAGRPGLAFAAALPRGTTGRLAGGPGMRPLLRGVVRLTQPAPAAMLHALALWAWHVPVAFEAALENSLLHTLEHASFLGTALLLWAAVFRAGRTLRTAPAGALAVFFTFVHSGFLGGILSLAPVPLYPSYGVRPSLWGLDLLTDQQLAGLIMWVPMGPVYLAAFLWLLARLLGPAARSAARAGAAG